MALEIVVAGDNLWIRAGRVPRLSQARAAAGPFGSAPQVIVDVSGEAYLDLEKRAAAMMSRD
jgi:hypothetical protein